MGCRCTCLHSKAGMHSQQTLLRTAKGDAAQHSMRAHLGGGGDGEGGGGEGGGGLGLGGGGEGGGGLGLHAGGWQIAGWNGFRGDTHIHSTAGGRLVCADNGTAWHSTSQHSKHALHTWEVPGTAGAAVEGCRSRRETTREATPSGNCAQKAWSHPWHKTWGHALQLMTFVTLVAMGMAVPGWVAGWVALGLVETGMAAAGWGEGCKSQERQARELQNLCVHAPGCPVPSLVTSRKQGVAGAHLGGGGEGEGGGGLGLGGGGDGEGGGGLGGGLGGGCSTIRRARKLVTQTAW